MSLNSSPEQLLTKASFRNSKNPDSQTEFSPFKPDYSGDEIQQSDNFAQHDSLESSMNSRKNLPHDKSIKLALKYQTAPFTSHPGLNSTDSGIVHPSHYPKQLQKLNDLRTEDLDIVPENSVEQSQLTQKQHLDSEGNRALSTEHFASERTFQVRSSLERLNKAETERNSSKIVEGGGQLRENPASNNPTGREASAKNFISPRFQSELHKTSEKQQVLVNNENDNNKDDDSDDSLDDEFNSSGINEICNKFKTYLLGEVDLKTEGEYTFNFRDKEANKKGDQTPPTQNEFVNSGTSSFQRLNNPIPNQAQASNQRFGQISYSAYKNAKASQEQYNDEELRQDVHDLSKHSLSHANSVNKSNLSSNSRNEGTTPFERPVAEKGLSITYDQKSNDVTILQEHLLRFEEKLQAKEEQLEQMKSYYNDLWISYDHTQKDLQKLKNEKDLKTEDLESEVRSLKKTIKQIEESNFLLKKENKELLESQQEQKENQYQLRTQNEGLKEELKVISQRYEAKIDQLMRQLKKIQSDTHIGGRTKKEAVMRSLEGDDLLHAKKSRGFQSRSSAMDPFSYASFEEGLEKPSFKDRSGTSYSEFDHCNEELLFPKQAKKGKIEGESLQGANAIDALQAKLKEYKAKNLKLSEENQNLLLELKSRPTLRQYKELEAQLKHFDINIENDCRDARKSSDSGFYKRFVHQIRHELGLESTTEILQKIQSLVAQCKNSDKFNKAIIEMIVQCAPVGYFSSKPSLKQAWKYVKRIMEEFVILKRSMDSLKDNTGQPQRILKTAMDYLMVDEDSKLPLKLKELVNENNHMDIIINKFKSLTEIDGTSLAELNKTLDFELRQKTIENSKITGVW